MSVGRDDTKLVDSPWFIGDRRQELSITFDNFLIDLVNFFYQSVGKPRMTAGFLGGYFVVFINDKNVATGGSKWITF